MARRGIGSHQFALLAAWASPLAASVVATPVLIRRLGAGPYGLFALVTGIALAFTAVGLARPVAVATARLLDTATLVRRGVGVAVAGGATLAAYALVGPVGGLAGDGVGAGDARAALGAGALSVIGISLLTTFSGTALGGARFRALGWLTALVGVATSIGYVGLALAGAGVPALLLWNAVVTGTGALAFAVLHRGPVDPSQEGPEVGPGGAGEAGATRIRVAPYLVGPVCGHAALVLERVALSAALGPAAVSAYVVPQTLVLLPHAAAVWLESPLLAAVAAGDDPAAAIRASARRLRWLAMSSVVGLGLLGRPLVAAVIGPEVALIGWGTWLLLVAYGVGLLATVVPWTVDDAWGGARRNAAVGVTWLGLVALAALGIGSWGIVAVVVGRAAMLLTLPAYRAAVWRHFPAPVTA